MDAHSACPGCGLVLADETGPVHAYVVTSPACWALYNEMLPNMTERLFSDAYMTQHPDGDDPRQTQSVAAHLITIYSIKALGQPLDKAAHITRAAVEYGRRNGGYPTMRRPDVWPLTIVDVADVGESTYVESTLEKWLELEASRIERWSRASIELLYR